MKLWAISDLHTGVAANREAVEAMADHGSDWLVVAGDVAEAPERFEATLASLSSRFGRLLWAPGNHDLWTVSRAAGAPRGVAKYEQLVAICRRLGVVTPEDPFPVWDGLGGRHVVAPLFVLYDYGFRPASVPLDGVVGWAEEEASVCADEVYLHPDPYPSRQAWCAARCAATERRLAALSGERTVLVNHFPLRRDLVRLPRIPRFSPWCGTPRTAGWAQRFRATVVVSGHLHVPGTQWRDGVRCEEVSLGYPRQWDPQRGVDGYLRQILPDPAG